MGIFSGLGQRLHDPNFAMRLQAGLAAANGDPGAMMQMRALMARQDQQRREEELAANLRGQAAESAAAQGYTKAQIQGLNPDDISALTRENLVPRQFGPEGGSIARVDANTGQRTYERAPWQRQVGRTIVQGDQNGAVTLPYEGVEPVAVADGGALYGITGRGRIVDPSQVPGETPALPSAPPTAPVAPISAGRPTAAAGAPRAYGNPVQELTQIVGMPPSSGYRTQGHQDALRRQGLTNARHSAHTDRDAIDFPIPAGPQQQAAAARIRQRYPQARFEFEGTNLHVTLPGWGAAPDVSGSARRYPGPAGAPRTGGSGQAQLIAQARAAIAAGRDPAAVRARLRQMGVNDSGF